MVVVMVKGERGSERVRERERERQEDAKSLPITSANVVDIDDTSSARVR